MAFNVLQNLSAIRLSAGEPIYLQYQPAAADGTPEVLTGRAFTFAIYAGGVQTEAFEAQLLSDATGSFAMWQADGTHSEAYRGRTDLRWEIAERLNKGRDVILTGVLTVDNSAPTIVSLPTAPESRTYARIKRSNDATDFATSPRFVISYGLWTGSVAAPAFTANPSITGTATVGQTLSGQDGTITNGAVSARQWLRDGVAISGAISTTYVLVSADQSKVITYRVTATGAGGSTVATSAGTAAVAAAPVAPSWSVQPSITGTATVGQTLSGQDGTITNGTVSARQWLRDAVAISGATGTSYALVSADEGKVITYRVSATGPGGSASATSAGTAAVAAAPVSAPANTTAPAVTGTAAVGSVLTTTNGTWTNSPTSYAYAWLRDGTAISGATSATYTVASADEGKSLTCRVTATNTGGSASATSNAVAIPAAVVAAPVSTGGVVASGTPEVGQTLSTTNGSWTNSPTAYAYQWLRNGSNITGATSATYVLTSDDAGKTIRSRVTASNSGGSASATSQAVNVAVPVPTNTTAPVVSGTAAVGSVLTSTDGSWSGSPSSYTYQWYRDASAISGATASTYTVTSSDQGTSLTCRVVAVNAGGSSAAVASNAIAIAAALPAPVNNTAPAITGNNTVGSTLTTTLGSWSNGPFGFTVAWLRDGTVISGATATTYTVVTADQGKSITSRVTATNSTASTSALSNAVTVAGGAPAITFAEFVAPGDSRTASGGGYSNNGGTEGVSTALGASIAGWYPMAFGNKLLLGRSWNYGVGAQTSRGLTIRARVANNSSTGNTAFDETNVNADKQFNTGTEGKIALNTHPAQVTVHFMDVNDGNPPFFTSPLNSMQEESTQIDERQAGQPNGIQYVLNGMPKGPTPVHQEIKTITNGVVQSTFTSQFTDGEQFGEAGVVANDGKTVLEKTTGTPSANQYYVTTAGLYQFHSSREGQTVWITYDYQASGTTTAYMRTMKNWKNSSSPAPFVDPDTGTSYPIAGLRYNRPFIRLVDSWTAAADLTRDPTGMIAKHGAYDILGIHQMPYMAYTAAYKPLKAAFTADYPNLPDLNRAPTGNNARIAQANGVLKVFSGTLPGAMATAANVRSGTIFRFMHVTSGMTEIVNDGNGNLSGTGVTGTIDAGGNYALTWGTAPTNGGFLYAEQDTSNMLYNPYFDPAQGSGTFPTLTGLTGSIPARWFLVLSTSMTNALTAGTATVDCQPVSIGGGRYKMVISLSGYAASAASVSIQNENGSYGFQHRYQPGVQIRGGRNRSFKLGPNGRFYGILTPGHVTHRISTSSIEMPSPSGPLAATQHSATCANGSQTYPIGQQLLNDAGGSFSFPDIMAPIDTTGFTFFSNSHLYSMTINTDGAKPFSGTVEFSDPWARVTPS